MIQNYLKQDRKTDGEVFRKGALRNEVVAMPPLTLGLQFILIHPELWVNVALKRKKASCLCFAKYTRRQMFGFSLTIQRQNKFF